MGRFGSQLVADGDRTDGGAVVFDEDDPRRALHRLRPDVWAKGGDYEGTELPEAEVLRTWGGRVLLLPYLSGRSTTATLQSIEFGDLL